MIRQDLVAKLADRLSSIRVDHPLRVAIDGIDASGKTSLADELQAHMSRGEKTIIRASIDRFHNPAAVRYRQGRNSPLGYYEDSFNYTALVTDLLEPLGPGGSRRYRKSIYDYVRDEPSLSEFQTAPANSILLFDGIFILRNELREYWDYTIFLEISFQSSLTRAITRANSPGVPIGSLEQLFHQRYIPGQQHYMEGCNPSASADTVIVNEPLNSPTIKTFR